MTPHVSGSTQSAQARYAAGIRNLENWLAGKPIRPEYLIVDGGGYAGTGAPSYRGLASRGGVDRGMNLVRGRPTTAPRMVGAAARCLAS